MTHILSGLYAIIDNTHRQDLSVVELTHFYLQGGARFLQLRQKNASKKEIRENAQHILDFKKEYDFTFILNDFPDIAIEVGADGVHLGQEDMPIEEARKIVGPDAIIGKSTHSLDEAKKALQEDIHYLACGAIFSTQSKPAGHPVIGIEGLREILGISHIPVVAIGGIHRKNLDPVLKTGVSAVAIMSGLLSTQDIPTEVLFYVNRLNS